MLIDLMQLEFIDLILRKMATETESAFRVMFEVTSLFRIDDDGVHGTLPVRGLDWGCKNELIGKAVEAHVNSHWIYDPNRPNKVCCMYHKTPSGDWHLHLQVCYRTVRIHD